MRKKISSYSHYCLTSITLFLDQHGPLCLAESGAPVCRTLPGPPEGGVDWTLVFAHAVLGWGAELRQVTFHSVLIRGWLQALEVSQQSSLGLCLHLILGQEVHYLLDTPGVTLIDSAEQEEELTGWYCCCRFRKQTVISGFL